MTAPTSPPLLRVVRGDPTPEELAALTTVIAARASAQSPAEEPTTGGWADPAHGLRTPVRVGVGAWAASGRASGVRTRADW